MAGMKEVQEVRQKRVQQELTRVQGELMSLSQASSKVLMSRDPHTKDHVTQKAVIAPLTRP